jgi:hypothetical protein
MFSFFKNLFGGDSGTETQIRMELDKWERQEEVLWKQKSRIQWLREGDRNTKFFHNSLLQRRNQNRILTLVQGLGERTDSHEVIERELVNHFKTLLTEPDQDRMEVIHMRSPGTFLSLSPLTKIDS